MPTPDNPNIKGIDLIINYVFNDKPNPYVLRDILNDLFNNDSDDDEPIEEK